MEYARARKNEQALELAVKGFRRTSPLLRDHSTLLTAPHPIPDGLPSHGPSMIFALVYHDLEVLTNNEEIQSRSMELVEIVMTQHLKPEHRLLFEYVRPGGQLVDSDAGKTYLTGHAVESMWFMHRIYGHHGRGDRAAWPLRRSAGISSGDGTTFTVEFSLLGTRREVCPFGTSPTPRSGGRSRKRCLPCCWRMSISGPIGA